VALMRQSSLEGNSGVKQQPIVAGSALFALQMIQQLQESTHAARRFPDGFAAPHLQPLKACSEFLLLVLLVLDVRVQQQLQQCQSTDTAPASQSEQQQRQQQQQQAVEALLGSSAYCIWQQQDFWQQHNSIGGLSSTKTVTDHLLNCWQQQPAVPAADTSGLRLLQWLPGKLLQLASAYGITLEQCSGLSFDRSNRLLGRSSFQLAGTALECALKHCGRAHDMCEAALRQWVLLVQQLLPDRPGTRSSSNGSSDGGSSSSSNSGGAVGGGSSSSSSPTAAASTARCSSSSNKPASTLQDLLPELIRRLTDILDAYEESSNCDSNNSSNNSSNSSSSSSQRLSLALEVTAALESCMRALATVELLPAVDDPATSMVFENVIAGATAVSQLRCLLLANHSSDASHTQQLLQQGQLPLLCSIIKAFPVSKTVEWSFAEGEQVFESILITAGADDQGVAAACLELAASIDLSSSGGSSSGSTAGSSRLADSLSVLLLLARWLRVRVLQLQHTCQLVQADFEIVFSTAAAHSLPRLGREQMYAAGFNTNGRDLQAAVEVVDAAAQYATDHLANVMSLAADCLNEQQQQSWQAGSSSSSNGPGTISSSSSGPGASRSNTHAATAFTTLQAMQRLHRQLQDCLSSRARDVRSTLWYAMYVADGIAQGGIPPSMTNFSSIDEHERCRTELAAASSCEQLSRLLSSYQALWQLPRDVLLLCEQLLAGVPVGWCCNNPGCSNSDGPSERALVASKGCVCGGCRTARWVAWSETFTLRQQRSCVHVAWSVKLETCWPTIAS
jgi:hypothetical protein